VTRSEPRFSGVKPLGDLPTERVTMRGTVKSYVGRGLLILVAATVLLAEAADPAGAAIPTTTQQAGARDIDLWWRLAAISSCVCVAKAVTICVVHDARDWGRSVGEIGDLELDREAVMHRLRECRSVDTREDSCVERER
jgi:hypothetical protein